MLPLKDLSDEELLRYSRHILLEQFGVEGQSKLAASTALVIGAGGLGCPAAMYLAGAGVGRLVIADADSVDLTNLQRQILHTADRVGQLKVESARIQLQAFNPNTVVTPLAQRLGAAELDHWLPQVNVVLDCSDNFETRHAVNAACVKHRKPLVSGAAIRTDGQLACFDLRNPHSPCYHCLFPQGESVTEERCATMGVFAPLTGIVGSLQAAEALKLLAGYGQALSHTLWLFNALDSEWSKMRFKKDPACPVCATGVAEFDRSV